MNIREAIDKLVNRVNLSEADTVDVMNQRLDRLRAKAFIEVHDEHRQIGEGAAARAEGRERVMPGRVDEQEAGDLEVPSGDKVAAHAEDCGERDLRGSNVLRDAARLPRGDGRAADRVEETRLSVVDVAQDGDDRLAYAGHERGSKGSDY